MHAESRKRPHADEDDSSANKRRVLSSANGSPQPNGFDPEQDEPTLDNLEVYNLSITLTTSPTSPLTILVV